MFKILEVQDLSRPQCKRYLARVVIDTTNIEEIKSAIETCTEQVREHYTHVHVVWLYIYNENKLLCRTLWVDKTLKDVPLPKPLDYNDQVDDIGLVWS